MAQDPSSRADRPQIVCPQCGAPVPLGASSQPVPQGSSAHRRGALEPFEQQLWRAQRMEAASKLAGGIAQHFNQLLLGILGASRLAARNLEDHDAALPYLAEIAAAADRGAELTRTLLAFGRPHQPQLRPLRLAEALETTRAILREICGGGVRLEIDPPAPDVWIFADPEQIEHVLINLTINARDAMQGEGTISITTHAVAPAEAGAEAGPPQELVELRVRDVGPGMEPETVARAFEPFYTTKPDGTGLGLYTVYGIVDGLGGRIQLESELGAGTTFRIVLPRHDPVADAQDEEASPQRRPRVLVVEDERLIRVTLRHTLRQHGFEVLCASTTSEALSLFESLGGFDLVLTDLLLRGGTGADLARELEQRQPGLAVVFMSAHTREHLVRHGRIDPHAQSLEKPFTEESLLEVVRGALAGASTP